MINDASLQRLKLAASEAAADASLWQPYVADLARCLGATSVHFRTPRPPGAAGRPWWVAHGAGPDLLEQYARHWGAHDPWANHPRGHKASAVGRCYIGSEFLSWPELQRTPFYNDFGRRAGLKGVLSALVDDESDGLGAITKIALFREDGQPEFEGEQQRALQHLQPSLRRALRSQWAFRLLQARATAVEDTLEALPHAVFLLGRNADLEHANSHGSRLRAEGVLRIVGRRASGLAQLGDRNLADLVSAACAGLAQECGLWLPGGHDLRTGHVLLSALSPSSPLAANWPRAAVLMAVQWDHPVRTRRARLEALNSRTRLTSAEQQVLERLVAGSTAEEIAQAQGVRVSTVRTHVRRLLEKTYTRRVVDLVRLVAG